MDQPRRGKRRKGSKKDCLFSFPFPLFIACEPHIPSSLPSVHCDSASTGPLRANSDGPVLLWGHESSRQTGVEAVAPQASRNGYERRSPYPPCHRTCTSDKGCLYHISQ